MLNISYIIAPIPDYAFFEQTVLKNLLGKGFFKLTCFAAQTFDFRCIGFAFSITRQAFLACFEKVFRPTIIKVLINAFDPAKFSYAVFTAQALKYNADLFFCALVSAGRTANIFNRLLRASSSI